VVLSTDVFASVQDAQARRVLYRRRNPSTFVAGYHDLLYAGTYYSYSRETFDPNSLRPSHNIPAELERQMRAVTQFDVVGDVVITRAILGVVRRQDARAARRVGPDAARGDRAGGLSCGEAVAGVLREIAAAGLRAATGEHAPFLAMTRALVGRI